MVFDYYIGELFKTLFMRKILLLIVLLFSAAAYISAQTAGTLTFSVNLTSHNSTYGYDHYVAIWIENGTSTFVKTKYKMADSHGTTSHLPVWKTASGGNTTDAVTGASLHTYSSPCTISWNATDVPGSIVTDGTYTIHVEFTWAHGGSTASTSYTFTKGQVADVQNPADQTEFKSVSISWQPDLSGMETANQDEGYSIYPNPVSDFLLVSGKNISNIEVYTITGELVYSGNLKTIDLVAQPAGVYLVNIMNETGRHTERIFKQ